MHWPMNKSDVDASMMLFIALTMFVSSTGTTLETVPRNILCLESPDPQLVPSNREGRTVTLESNFKGMWKPFSFINSIVKAGKNLKNACVVSFVSGPSTTSSTSTSIAFATATSTTTLPSTNLFVVTSPTDTFTFTCKPTVTITTSTPTIVDPLTVKSTPVTIHSILGTVTSTQIVPYTTVSTSTVSVSVTKTTTFTTRTIYCSTRTCWQGSCSTRPGSSRCTGGGGDGRANDIFGLFLGESVTKAMTFDTKSPITTVQSTTYTHVHPDNVLYY